MADFKTEIKPEIKLDPAESPTKLDDIDEFEDDTDLIFPNEATQGNWLVKVSGDMWKVWNDIYQNQPDDAEIEVGTLRVYDSKPGDAPDTQKVQLILNNGIEKHNALPKVYTLDMRAHGYNNTVVFSEKDLERHRAKGVGNTRNLAAGKPSGIGKGDRYGPRKPGSYRTAIPKQTILAPPIVEEAVAKPVEDQSSLEFFKRQYDAALNDGKKTKFINRIDKKHYHPGAASSGFTFGSITSKPGKGLKKKEPKEKNVRMPEEQLLDALQQCFRQYPYWSMSALRSKLRQPDAYIKEVLEKIAVLVRSGDFTGNYKLNENTARLLNIQDLELKEEAAPIKSEVESDQGTGDEMGDEDDDLGDFEDVKMGEGAS